MATERPLSIACTPDSDDAFYYEALEAGRVALEGARRTLMADDRVRQAYLGM